MDLKNIAIIICQKNEDPEELKRRNKRLIENAIKLYSEKTHFIYELLQNAEDTRATRVRFLQFDDRLEVLHDGEPFTLSNLESLCDAANSDKVDQKDKIGKFGIGFKSVFAICKTVKLYTEPRRQVKDDIPRGCVEIYDYIYPKEQPDDRNMPAAPYTTKFVFPYDVSLYGKSVEELKEDLAKKLRNLGADVLLFMKHLKEIEYDIQIGRGPARTYNGKNTYKLNRRDIGKSMRKVTIPGNGNNDLSYIVFSKTDKFEGLELSADIAFAAIEENGEITFRKMNNTNIYTYFPTDEKSNLHFIVQAPFKLTPNRSGLEADNKCNKWLANLISGLLGEAIFEIKDKKWLSLEFIDLLPYDNSNPSYGDNWHFRPLHEKTYELLTKEEIIPAGDGSYVRAKNARVARSKPFAEFFKCNLFDSGVKWLQYDFTESGKLGELYRFLTKARINNQSPLVREIGFENLPALLRDKPNFLETADNDRLKNFYNLLAQAPYLLGKNGDMWSVPFIKTTDGAFREPFILHKDKDDKKNYRKPNIFIKPKDSYNTSGGTYFFADTFIKENCADFLYKMEIIEPDKFNDFLRELENIKGKDTSAEDNVRRVKLAIKFLRAGKDNADKRFYELLNLVVIDTEWNPYCNTADAIQNYGTIYREKDVNGIDLKHYFYHVNCYAYILDEEFYKNRGLTDEDLKVLEEPLGIKKSVYEGLDKVSWSEGNANCKNWGKFRKHLNFACISQVLGVISNYPYKSGIIMQLLQKVETRLAGTWQYRDKNPDFYNDTAQIVTFLKNKEWLFSSNGELVSPAEISPDVLDTKIYGNINGSSEFYEILGFQKSKKGKDSEEIEKYIKEYQEGLVSGKQLISYIKEIVREEDDEDEEDTVFVPGKREAFPDGSVSNLEELRRRVRQRYNNTPDVEYEFKQVRKRINQADYKGHIGYTYGGFCQICEQHKRYCEVASLFNNPQKELEQMCLSLCPEHATEYRILRNDDKIMEAFKNEILRANLSTGRKAPNAGRIGFNGETFSSIRFNEEHLAQIQEIIRIEKANNVDTAFVDPKTEKPDFMPPKEEENKGGGGRRLTAHQKFLAALNTPVDNSSDTEARYDEPKTPEIVETENPSDGDTAEAGEETVRQEPNTAKESYNSGIERYNSHDDDDAILYFNKAIRYKQDFGEAYYYRGRAYGRKKEYMLAIADFTAAIVLEPKSAKAHYYRGLAYTKKGDCDNAIKDFTKVVQLDTCYVEAYNSRGLAYVKKGAYHRAIHDFDNVISYSQQDATDAMAYYNKGLAYKKIYEVNMYNDASDSAIAASAFDSAISAFESALRIKPDFTDATAAMNKLKTIYERELKRGAEDDFVEFVEFKGYI